LVFDNKKFTDILENLDIVAMVYEYNQELDVVFLEKTQVKITRRIKIGKNC